MVNWSLITESTTDSKQLRNFAEGKISGTEFYDMYKNTEKAGTIRNLLREHGVTYARSLARKALRRRGYSVNFNG